MQKYLALLFLLALADQSNASALFSDTTVLDIELTGPLSTLIENKDDREQVPFALQANNVDYTVKVRVRGNSRTRICEAMPLRLNFAKKNTKGTIFAGQDKLKLVIQCFHHDSSRIDILEEYAAYRIFSLITDYSFKTRLVHVRFTDTDGQLDEKLSDLHGFLIESTDQLSARLETEEISAQGLQFSKLNHEHAAAVFVFQYLIANTDWSFVAANDDDECCHNGAIFRTDSQLYYVPYDFDLAGLVNARYARPDSSLRIERVRQRLYRGYCTSPEVLIAAIQTVNSHKAEILAVPSEIPGLTDRDVKALGKYLNKFFAAAENEEKLLKLFERRCLGPN